MLQYAKAIVAALIAGLTTLGGALSDGHVSTGEWIAVAIAVLGGLGFTAAVPNRQANRPTRM
jgi:hypothetical protein